MSRSPRTLDTLALAISYLRSPQAFPETANEIALDVVPVVRGMYAAMAAIGEHARPDNWDDSDDPDQRAAWLQFDAALAAFDAGQLPAPVPTGETA